MYGRAANFADSAGTAAACNDAGNAGPAGTSSKSSIARNWELLFLVSGWKAAPQLT